MLRFEGFLLSYIFNGQDGRRNWTVWLNKLDMIGDGVGTSDVYFSRRDIREALNGKAFRHYIEVIGARSTTAS